MSVAKSVEQQTITVGGILLAAGAGLRFGKPKVLAHDGAWLRAGVAALSGGGCDDVVVVLGAAIVDIPEPARAVVAANWSAGVSDSVRTGLLALGDAVDYAVITTVDTPDVDAAAVCRVVQAARASSSGLVRAVYDGRPGHPVVIARRHWSDLLAMLRGDEGAGPFLKARDDVVAVECADLATGEDIDEP